MPSKVNEFYEAGRELYLKQMDGVITRVANIVGDDLTAAKKRIAAGRTEIASYVKSLPAGLKKVGAEASKEIADKFEQLEDDVNAKQESVVDTLASKYVESRKGLDERIEELQAENKGLVDKAIGAIKAIINTIRQLAAMLGNVLARVAGVVGDIIKAPVRFLGNLIDGVKGGILKFKDNILDHLRKGLMSWLFGALAEGGIELPDKFDLQGIIKLLASLFGLTWRNIRNRLVKQIGEKAMVAIEKGVEIFQIVSGPAGVAGLWQMLMEKLGDIKEMILDQVKDFVITRIITAGITWLIGLLNPAAAFIKACKLIYDVIMFFVNNAERIAKFVNTVIDSAADIVRGNIGGVVAKIEDVLSQMVPILIGFLASVIGIGGIGQKIREIIGKLQKPVTKAIDFVIKTGLKLAGPIIRGIKGIGSKVKAKVAAGKAYVKGKAEAGKKWAKGKVEAGKKWVEGKVEGRKAKPARVSSQEVKQLARRQLQPRLQNIGSARELRAVLTTVMANLRPQGLHRLHVVAGATERRFEIHAEASPGEKTNEVTPNIKLNLKDIDITVARSQFVTVARGFIDGRDIGTGRNNTPVAAGVDLETVEQQGRHAETSVLDKLNNMVMLERYPTSGQHLLELYVTRTPCNDCATRIERARRLFEAGGGSLDVTVRSLALYKGSRDAARNEETGRGTRAGGFYSLMRLQELGIRVEAWDLQRDARRLFGPGVDMRQVAAVGGRLKNKVDELAGELALLRRIDVR
jgi:uncharacterized protein YoxC